MGQVKIWEEKVMIPTYEIGEAQKAPVFLEKRVYQGSCGKVYPYPVIEKIIDIKVQKEYKAVFLENEYIKIMVLPELGGRIQRAYDKTNNYDFVYYNHVIKPALVGLTGPWISGGIEFNWPQHHRPTTFLPVDYKILDEEEDTKSLLLHDVDQMYGTKGIMKFTLYEKKAYIEIKGQLYNRTSLPQTFLWWANPAVAVNENTQSIFPPDVHAVMDHGKRDVSRFPIATGIYYKHDYSEGVDISRYKNIPVPTSFMAAKSEYDFIGGYDYGVEAGLLHVADHHISPGKKQWTWGNGDFGKAWDDNLTDEDGPYIELMTGVFTDNQPDFTWLKPFEEKTFTQYFMPYKKVGSVKNATICAAVNLEERKEGIYFCVYATSEYDNAKITIYADGEEIFSKTAKISPIDIQEETIPAREYEKSLKIEITQKDKILVVYEKQKKEETYELPKPAVPAKEPLEIMTNEELYFTGLHIEQYRHATYLPDAYYLEGLKRDTDDVRINQAYGCLLMRRGNFSEAEAYLKRALKRATDKNPNPYSGEGYYDLGLCLFYQKKKKEAYDIFYKATWSSEQQEKAFYYLAAISAEEKEYEKALEFVEKGLMKNTHNIKARGLKAYLLRNLDKDKEAELFLEESLQIDPFDFVSMHELYLLTKKEMIFNQMKILKRDFTENDLMIARDYAEFGAYEQAYCVLEDAKEKTPLIYYYMAEYKRLLLNRVDKNLYDLAKKAKESPYFPNKLEDIAVLESAIAHNEDDFLACYYLGNLFYDKLQFEKAAALWEKCEVLNPDFAMVKRNLALYYQNKKHDTKSALACLESAFESEPDSRLFMEYDQLLKKGSYNTKQRLALYEAHMNLVKDRDDLYIEYVTLLNATKQYQKAYDILVIKKFHPWEGGEGKVTSQYVISCMYLALEKMNEEKKEEALEYLQKALIYPRNLGEGKLEGTKDNQIHYWMGCLFEKMREEERAKEQFRISSIGNEEPKSMMYYNDQPADMIFYEGLSHLKLKEYGKAKSRFYALIDYAMDHENDVCKIEYFAVSLPDLMIFEDDLNQRNKAHCAYLYALGYLGLGEKEKAKNSFLNVLTFEKSHMKANEYLNNLSFF